MFIFVNETEWITAYLCKDYAINKCKNNRNPKLDVVNLNKKLHKFCGVHY